MTMCLVFCPCYSSTAVCIVARTASCVKEEEEEEKNEEISTLMGCCRMQARTTIVFQRVSRLTVYIWGRLEGAGLAAPSAELHGDNDTYRVRCLSLTFQPS